MRTYKATSLTLGLLTALAIGITHVPALAATSNDATIRDESRPAQSATRDEARPDLWISTKVKAKLMADDVLNGLEIKVSTHDGVVQLAGWVKEPEQIGEAEKIAGSVLGVKQVKNDLLVTR